MIEPERTILVVDDDPDVREIALVVLEEAGYRVLEAASGDEALHLLLAHPGLRVDVLFTDVMMPGRLDGIDLADAVSALCPGLPVLYTTGLVTLPGIHRGTDLHGPVLHKPYRPSELRRAVMSLLAPVS